MTTKGLFPHHYRYPAARGMREADSREDGAEGLFGFWGM